MKTKQLLSHTSLSRNPNANFSMQNRHLFLDNSTIIECPVYIEKTTIVASGDGLFAICNFFRTKHPDTEPIILWNPYTGKMRRVVPVGANDDILSITFNACRWPMMIFGFGYDCISATYKLVRVAYFNVTGYGSPGVGTYLQPQVYDLGLKTWRRSTDVVNMSLNAYTIRWRGVYFKGVIHWVCSIPSGDDNKLCWTILTFNLGTEQFGEIKLPKDAGDVTTKTVSIVVFPKKSSCLKEEVLGVIHSTATVLSLWVMEECWVKIFDVQLPQELRKDMNVAILDDDLVVFQLSSWVWMSYNIKTKQVAEIMRPDWIRDYAGSYMESLLLLLG